MDKSVLELLKNKVSGLTESQRKVADYIIKNPVDVAFLTVDQLANLVGTSTTTIMRLTFSMGYSGYSEFQKELQELLRNRVDPGTRLQANLKSVNKDDLWVRCAEQQIENIRFTFENNSAESLDAALNLIASSHRIFSCGARSAWPVAQSLGLGLNRLLGNCEVFNPDDKGSWPEKICSLTESDLVIVVSFPRYSRNVVEFAMEAEKVGARVIAITDGYSSPLASCADLLMPCKFSSIAFQNSIIGAMLIVDYLISAVAINHPETKERLDRNDSVMKLTKYHFLD